MQSQRVGAGAQGGTEHSSLHCKIGRAVALSSGYLQRSTEIARWRYLNLLDEDDGLLLAAPCRPLRDGARFGCGSAIERGRTCISANYIPCRDQDQPPDRIG